MTKEERTWSQKDIQKGFEEALRFGGDDVAAAWNFLTGWLAVSECTVATQMRKGE